MKNYYLATIKTSLNDPSYRFFVPLVMAVDNKDGRRIGGWHLGSTQLRRHIRREYIYADSEALSCAINVGSAILPIFDQQFTGDAK